MRARLGARVAAAAPAMMGELLCCTHCPFQSTRARLSRPTSGYPRTAATATVAEVVAVAAALVARSEASWLAAAALGAPLLAAEEVRLVGESETVSALQGWRTGPAAKLSQYCQ